MRMGRRVVAWVIWACKPSAYLTVDRNERPRWETAGAFRYMARCAKQQRLFERGGALVLGQNTSRAGLRPLSVKIRGHDRVLCVAARAQCNDRHHLFGAQSHA